LSVPAIWSRILMAVGLAGMLAGAIDPLEGSFVILPSVAVVALGTLIGKSRHLVLLGWSFGLALLGVVAMVVLSWLGGIGGNSGRSMWWGVFILPYPIGWALGFISGGIALIESWRFHALMRHASK
jgi:hypothetical protein